MLREKKISQIANEVYFNLRKSRDIELEDDERKPMPEEYLIFKVIRIMGWDYWTYQRQPDFFIEMCKAFIAAEQKAENDKRNTKK